MVGARGVRLSGGQLQRAAGARAMAHRPELLVLDDLTSALDVDTEVGMWQRLAASGYTVLAATNSIVANPAGILRSVNYDPLRDFTPITRLAGTYQHCQPARAAARQKSVSSK